MSAPSGYLIGLVGAGIGPSLSPALHEREADELGLRYLYRRLDLDALGVPPQAVGELLAAARLAGYDGLNITHPCKQLVVDRLDAISPEAADLNAVNTVVFTGAGAVGYNAVGYNAVGYNAVGYNTDVSGFARAFGRGLPEAARERVVLLGAGGAGAAVAHALLTLGAGTIQVLDLDRRRSADLVAALRSRFGTGRAVAGESDGASTGLAAALRDADGLVHATPTGMAAHPGSPVPAELLRPELWLADVVYRPLDTALLRAARAAGCRVLDGGAMAVFQAADAFRLFTGVEPDAERMLRHFDELAAHHPEGSVRSAGN